MARSLAETLNEAALAAVQASAWERDQEAWNLPRAPGEAIAPEANEDHHEAGTSGPAEQAEPPEIAPEAPE